MTSPWSLLVGQDTTEYWKWSVSGCEVIVVSVESIDFDSSWEQIVGKKTEYKVLNLVESQLEYVECFRRSLPYFGRNSLGEMA